VPEVTARSTKLSDDGRHDHVYLAGVSMGHITSGEAITMDVDRMVTRTWIGERFFIKLPDGTEADVIAGKCPVCGLEPYFRTAADAENEQKLLELPPAG